MLGHDAAMATSNSTQPGLRIASLNMWGTRGDWPARRATFAEGFQRLAPDLLTLQETILTDPYDQARDLLGEGYLLIHQAARESDGQGVTTASRWPVGRTLEVNLQVSPRTGDFACTSLVTEIIAPEPFGRIWLVNHLPDWQLDHEHERQLRRSPPREPSNVWWPRHRGTCSWPETSMPIRTRPACGSGPGGTPSTD